MSDSKPEIKQDKAIHNPVLVEQLLFNLWPNTIEDNEWIMVDATCGEGGHAQIFLDKFPDLILLCVDADSKQIEFCRKKLKKYKSRVNLFNIWFSEFFTNYHSYYNKKPDRILLDLGISRFHYEKSGRGFSFKKQEPLDMRYNNKTKLTAYAIVNKS